MQIREGESPLVSPGPSPLEMDLRIRLSRAHLEAQEARAKLIDGEQLVARYRLRAEAGEGIIAVLEQQLTRLEEDCTRLRAEMNAIHSSRWWRLKYRVRGAIRGITRPLPSPLRRFLRGILRRLKKAVPA